MASLKEVKTRINSVKSTRKITSAMKMVASAKLHKAQGAIENMLPYERKLNKILTNFLSADLPVESPYIKAREVKRVAIVVFSSNTSLCGAFNANVIKMLLQTVGEFRTLGQDNILIFPVGKKVDEAVKRLGFQPQETSPTLSDKPSYQEASELAHRLMEMYVSGEIDRVELIYHHFKSMGVQILLRETYLPIDLTRVVDEEEKQKEEEVQGGEIANDYIIEPSAEELIANLIPTVLSQKLFTAAVDSNASEHAARTLAMQVATDNANELIQDLTKQYNKSRQQAITNELLDIVGGSMQ
ncbi:F0F1 ATP synthase subunit gamma [Bacteroides thetaiotaomicron]|uniref:F0F1 ATP synthase subunit gamma n=1 Tax=Bacteroides thetaiotaomicron TaxID=818 RepID=UPI00189D054F|nr:F0F1 ATP synthase subunit gamma [Bacteroides thetaiotaomicron]MCA6002557.1 F0F1 ATP synthase subunit gamma [Bacteroides thetaiotaomicron]MDC2130306.1 F0F1 ATP synthase subunit gamma [Bacteroides thetaiotaomicron]MDC2134967.1 F0F1 ATP synthase subunit gamma [Bacteroides thetaiotaomicron]MDC2139438.1 F0F1 ATP synthase subunit gamma [Bacteroides thetaiotaomicron]MDC2144470.1 F0F1 ATP synthase subunit gamma [Bacteroides thetaiotaomicron]